MKESKDNEVTLVTLTAIGLHTVVDFAYTGTIHITLDNVQEVKQIRFHVRYLKGWINIPKKSIVVNRQ